MQKLLSSLSLYFILNLFACAQDEKNIIFNIDSLQINDLKIFDRIESDNGVNYYRYINLKAVKEALGKPDKVATRISETLETEIVTLTYGNSYVEFYNHFFEKGTKSDTYSLYSLTIKDDKFWLMYDGKIYKIGKESSELFKHISNDNETTVKLKRGSLNEISDYVIRFKFVRSKVSEISATFD